MHENESLLTCPLKRRRMTFGDEDAGCFLSSLWCSSSFFLRHVIHVRLASPNSIQAVKVAPASVTCRCHEKKNMFSLNGHLRHLP